MNYHVGVRKQILCKAYRLGAGRGLFISIFLLLLSSFLTQTLSAQTSNPNVPAVPTAEPPPLPMPPVGVPDSGNDNLDLPPVSIPKRPGIRDPFAKPKSLLDREADATKPVIDPAVYIDARIEPIRRFPLRNYTLVGIIFDVESPKAMIKDPEGNMHMVSKNQRIGNQEGVIEAIERGEVKVEEKGKQLSIRLLKSN